jgi:aspartyl-tRNA(Asn)/glutamyl-tRNA(Gln) amidotransferase subunit A
MNIEQAAAKLRAREISAVELAQESLRRIRETQPLLNAFITITDDLALEQARRADEELSRGIDRGPLHGLPYALKDLFETRGIRTTAGSKIFANYIPDRDCEVYQKLTAAGAVLMGKTGMHELAYGITNDNPHFGPVRNPRDPARISGGSSGGSAAAVAADLVFFAMGTDTGGSIRIPAAYCGCVGLKPTFGRVSRSGVLPLSSSMDHVGPLTRTARDAALVMQAITDFDPGQPVSIAGCRIGVPQNFFSIAEESVQQAERLGARMIPLSVPDPAETNTVARIILLAEASALMQPYLHRRGEFGTDVLALLDQGCLISATDYVNAQRLRAIHKRRWDAVWEQVDFIFTPTTPIQPPLIGQTVVMGEDVRMTSTRYVRPLNALGFPAVSIPTNALALQIIGKCFDDAGLLAVAEAISLFYV